MGSDTVSSTLKKKRDDLTGQRDALFKKYSQTPQDLDLAQQIKGLMMKWPYALTK